MCIMNTILKIPGEKQMKKIDPALLSIQNTEEEHYLITQKEAEMLSRGELTFHNGVLYRTEHLFPQKVEILELKQDGEQPLNLHSEDKQRPKLQDLTISNREWSQASHHPMFNGPTQTQIERCKQYPPVEVKGVHLKSSKSTPETQTAVRALLAEIDAYPDKHPFKWVRSAESFVEFSGDKRTKGILLQILNSAIPLKSGMKLEGFSAKEFDEKYLHTQPSLLEEWTAGHEPTLNAIRTSNSENLRNATAEDMIPHPIDINYVVESPSYLSLEIEGMENSHIKELEGALKELYYNGNYGVSAFQFIELAGTLYGEYKGHVHMLDPDDFDPELTKWVIAIHFQDVYWELFRGRTISILKLFNKFFNPDDKLYHLETPITGMKKR